MGRFSIPMVGFLLLCCLSSLTKAEYPKYKDPKQPLNSRIRDLMSRMTLAEKIGQMVQIEREVATPDVMTKYFIGKPSSNVGLVDSLLCNFLIQFISLFINVDRVPILCNLAIQFIDVGFAGSVLSAGGSVPAPKASAKTWVNLVNGIQKGSLSTRLGIPMIYGIDAVHGHNNVYNATIFPHNVGLGATRQVMT